MAIDSAERLREWGTRLEQALGITVVVNHGGALALKTKAGHVMGISPVPWQATLIFTGTLGMADDTMSHATLRALLAVNLNQSLAGMGRVGIAPDGQEILFQLVWSPAETSWTDEAFSAVLMAFAEHVDVLAAAISNGELEHIFVGTPLDDGGGVGQTADQAGLA